MILLVLCTAPQAALAQPDPAASADATTLYVAPSGDDRAPGTRTQPLATLEAARDRLRMLRADRAVPATVVLRGGRYERTTPFRLTADDGGQPGVPVVYRAFPGEQPRLAGGRRIDRFTPLADQPAADRVPAEARPSVRVADLRALDITDYGTLEPRGFNQNLPAALEVVVDGRPLPLARWPNAGWTTIVAATDADGRPTFTYAGDRPARWAEAPDAWLHGFWMFDWADQHLPVARLETATRQITLGAQHAFGLRAGQRFYALNLLEELDAPGEWYLDRATGHLYLWPPTDLSDAEVVVTLLDGPILHADGAAHVRFEGLTLEAGRDVGLRVDGGTDVVLAHSSIRAMGRKGIVVEGGTQHRIVACEIAHPGEEAIELTGGDRATLTPGDHRVLDTHLHHFGRWTLTATPAIELWGVGHRIAHTLMHDGPHSAIAYHGNDHVIEFNEVHHVVLQSSDAGAIYNGRNWTERGHQIRYNYLHHVGPTHAPPVPDAASVPGFAAGPARADDTNLIYLDDAASGASIYGNLLQGTYRALHIGGGHDHLVQNNVIVGSHYGVWLDARGQTWAKDRIARGGSWQMYEKLAAVRYDEPPYSTAYPQLAGLLDGDPAQPRGHMVERNVFVGVEEPVGFIETTPATAAVASNLHLGVDAVAGADPFDARRLLASLPAERLVALGITPLPFARMGRLYLAPSRRLP